MEDDKSSSSLAGLSDINADHGFSADEGVGSNQFRLKGLQKKSLFKHSGKGRSIKSSYSLELELPDSYRDRRNKFTSKIQVDRALREIERSQRA